MPFQSSSFEPSARWRSARTEVRQLNAMVSEPSFRLEQLVNEVVARGLGAAVMQLHLPLRAGILARAPRDDKDRIPAVIEGTLYGDHPVLELERPQAFPALAHDHAHAVAVVATHLRLVGCI